MGEEGNGRSTAHPGVYEESGFFGVLAHQQSYLNIIYLLLSFPLGIFYFVFIITGLSLGFGLAVIGVGLFILLAVLVAMRGFAAVERQLAIWLLGLEIRAPNPGPDPWSHPLIALKKHVTDSYTWKCLAYLLVKFPLGIISFVIAVAMLSVTLTLVLAPLLYLSLPLHILNWQVTRLEEAMLCLALGLLLGLITVHALNGIAAIWRQFAARMLEGAPAARKELKRGPVVIG
jgi:hypothetical protein